MAEIDKVIEERIRTAVATVSRFGSVACAYLFGSHVNGQVSICSDIDVAIFIEELEEWDIHHRARVATQVQKEAGDELEVHFLPSGALEERKNSSFAAWVLAHGVEIQP